MSDQYHNQNSFSKNNQTIITPEEKASMSPGEYRREYQRRYYPINKERAKEYQRKYNLTHKKKKKTSTKSTSGLTAPREVVKETLNVRDFQNLHEGKIERMLEAIIKGKRLFAMNTDGPIIPEDYTQKSMAHIDRIQKIE